jgi:calcineurin-like phosphoesterase family protein
VIFPAAAVDTRAFRSLLKSVSLPANRPFSEGLSGDCRSYGHLFTSDTHFGHGGALGLYRWPFASVAAMNEAMIERWNDTVGAGDEVWHLGDFAIRQPAAVTAELLVGLNGNKHLVAGNNDPVATTRLNGWSSVQPYNEIEVDGVSLVRCHYPFRSWRGMAKGWLNLHGHSHGRTKPEPSQFDVGVDVWDFRPVSLGQILERRRAERGL